MGKPPFCGRGSEEVMDMKGEDPTLLTRIPTQVGQPGLRGWFRELGR